MSRAQISGTSRLSIIICRFDGESITISRKLSLSETIQVQEPRKAIHDLSKAITIWLSVNIHLAATAAWTHLLLDSDHDGKLNIYLEYSILFYIYVYLAIIYMYISL